MEGLAFAAFRSCFSSFSFSRGLRSPGISILPGVVSPGRSRLPALIPSAHCSIKGSRCEEVAFFGGGILHGFLQSLHHVDAIVHVLHHQLPHLKLVTQHQFKAWCCYNLATGILGLKSHDMFSEEKVSVLVEQVGTYIPQLMPVGEFQLCKQIRVTEELDSLAELLPGLWWLALSIALLDTYRAILVQSRRHRL